MKAKPDRTDLRMKSRQATFIAMILLAGCLPINVSQAQTPTQTSSPTLVSTITVTTPPTIIPLTETPTLIPSPEGATEILVEGDVEFAVNNKGLRIAQFDNENKVWRELPQFTLLDWENMFSATTIKGDDGKEYNAHIVFELRDTSTFTNPEEFTQFLTEKATDPKEEIKGNQIFVLETFGEIHINMSPEEAGERLKMGSTVVVLESDEDMPIVASYSLKVGEDQYLRGNKNIKVVFEPAKGFSPRVTYLDVLGFAGYDAPGDILLLDGGGEAINNPLTSDEAQQIDYIYTPVMDMPPRFNAYKLVQGEPPELINNEELGELTNENWLDKILKAGAKFIQVYE